jgi:uncharacterized protein (UPF0276 family)
MKFGVKTYDKEEFLDFFIDKCDFFEVQAIQKNDYNFLKKYKLPIIVHCEHQGFGINFADSSKKDLNLQAIHFAKVVADSVNAKKIIVHPGILENENCSKENSINFLKEFCDSRFCIENMPYSYQENKSIKLCSEPKEMQEFMDKTGLGFCFDINHAIEYALELGLDYLNVLKEFSKIKATHYHLGGENLDKRESHLSFADSDLDLDLIFKILPKKAEVTLEVGISKESVLNDLKVVGRV